MEWQAFQQAPHPPTQSACLLRWTPPSPNLACLPRARQVQICSDYAGAGREIFDKVKAGAWVKCGSCVHWVGWRGWMGVVGGLGCRPGERRCTVLGGGG